MISITSSHLYCFAFSPFFPSSVFASSQEEAVYLLSLSYCYCLSWTLVCGTQTSWIGASGQIGLLSRHAKCEPEQSTCCKCPRAAHRLLLISLTHLWFPFSKTAWKHRYRMRPFVVFPLYHQRSSWQLPVAPRRDHLFSSYPLTLCSDDPHSRQAPSRNLEHQSSCFQSSCQPSCATQSSWN